MKIREYRQSDTSPLKFHIELTPEEMERFQDKKQRVLIIREMIEHATNVLPRRKENNE